jgi:hypothetical protein
VGGKGGGSAPAPPPAPDPVATAQAQGAINRETAVAQARLNRTNEITPLGSRKYDEYLIPGTSDLYGATATTSLNPVPQQAFDAEQRVGRDLNLLAEGQVGRVNETVGTPFNLNGIQARQDQVNTSEMNPYATSFGQGINYQDDISTSGMNNYALDPSQNAEDAIYGKHAARLDPRFQQQQSDLTQNLANRGIYAGSTAYDREIGNFGRERNDAYGQARNDAITQGIQYGNQQREQQFGEGQAQAQFYNQAQNQRFSDAGARAQFGNQARAQQFNEAGAQAQLANSGRQQDIQERAYLRNIPLNDVAALLGTGQVNVPQFGAVPQTGINAADYQGAVANNYSGQVNAYNAQQAAAAQRSSGMMGALGSIAGAGITAY